MTSSRCKKRKQRSEEPELQPDSLVDNNSHCCTTSCAAVVSEATQERKSQEGLDVQAEQEPLVEKEKRQRASQLTALEMVAISRTWTFVHWLLLASYTLQVRHRATSCTRVEKSVVGVS